MAKFTQVLLDSDKRVGSKFLARVFGYMFIGLVITAIIAFVFPTIAFRNPTWYDGQYITDAGFTMIMAVSISSLVVALIDAIVIMIWSRKSQKAPWIPYIIYSVAFGFALSVFVLLGISYEILAESFGISAAVFGVMGLIGYFSKGNMSGFKFVAITLGVLLAGYAIFFLIRYLILLGTNPDQAAWEGFWFDIAASAIILVIMCLVTAIDVNRVRKMGEQGITNNNMALLCAYELYADFIMILIRVLYFLSLMNNN